jgi:hypothetical protein
MNLSQRLDIAADWSKFDQERGSKGKKGAQVIDPSAFPQSVKHTDGRNYTRTGKYGHDMKTGEPSAEYSNHSNYGEKNNVERRIWRTAAGRVNEES